MAKKKIDPLNRKQYGAVSAMLTVSDIPAAVGFYQKALRFAKRGIMNGLDGKPIHAELTLRGTALMLGPGNAAMGKRTAKTVGASPAGLYLYMESVDKVVDKATKLSATSQGHVMDMFGGDRCGTIVDPDGYTWMVGTHKAEPTARDEREDARNDEATAGGRGRRRLTRSSLGHRITRICASFNEQETSVGD
jgi:PhnB protein